MLYLYSNFVVQQAQIHLQLVVISIHNKLIVLYESQECLSFRFSHQKTPTEWYGIEIFVITNNIEGVQFSQMISRKNFCM